MQFFAPEEKIPAGWRLGIFLMNTRVMKGFSSDYIREYILYWGSRSGLAISKESLEPLSFSIPIGGDPGQPWGAWVYSQDPTLTGKLFQERSKIPAVFSVTTAPSEIGWYLDTFQGPWMAGVVQAKVSLWATPGSPLAGGTWYTAGAFWTKGSPSEDELARRLSTIGCNLWSGPNAIMPYKAPQGLIFIFRTSDTPTTMGAVRDAVGAISMTIDLNSPVSDPYLSTGADKLMEASGGILESIGTAGEGIAEILKESGEATKTIGTVIGYLPWILAAGAVIFLWSQSRKRSPGSMYEGG